MVILQLIYPPVDGHLGCVQFLAVNTVMNIYIQVSVQMWAFISLNSTQLCLLYLYTKLKSGSLSPLSFSFSKLFWLF